MSNIKEINKYTKKTIKLIEKMEHNSFLLPDSWTEKIQMVNEEWSYKTYVGKRGTGRWINIEKYYGADKLIDLNFNGNNIVVNNLKLGDIVSPKEVFDFINAIYKEKHSFKNHEEGKRKIREKISKKMSEINTLKKDIEKLKKELKDSKNIK